MNTPTNSEALPPTSGSVVLTTSEREQIAEILDRRANDIASFQGDVRTWTGGTVKEYPGSVELALSRETKRLRKLADKVRPPSPEDDED